MLLDRRSLFRLAAPLGLAALHGRPAGALLSIPERGRARDLGVRIGRLEPARWNAITDVSGVEVGHATLLRDAPGRPGSGAVRTGVTAIWPSRALPDVYLPCGFAVPNGNGELSGLTQIAALGILASPICLTGTTGVGSAYEALLALQPDDGRPPVEPLVGETWDGFLHDVTDRHLQAGDVHRALDAARSGPVAEGSVGGGTGMICYGFKGGIGTASRRLPPPLASYALGALVQANHGAREQLRIDGVPVGEEITDLRPRGEEVDGGASIVVVLATDAPLTDVQLHRVARRAVHGLARTGSISHNSSGDFALAFSTASPIPWRDFWDGREYAVDSVEQFDLDPLFEAASEATEEAIVNALFAARDMEGREGHAVHALPLGRVLEILARHGRRFVSTGASAEGSS